MEDKEYRQKIVKLLKLNNIFAVVWDGHAARYYCLMGKLKNNQDVKCDIYAAIYESFFEIKGKELHRFKFNYDDNKTWKDMYDWTVQHLKKNKKYKLLEGEC